MLDYPLTTDFRASELLWCKHCGHVGPRTALVDHLQALRDAIGKPIVVTSGYRCPAHPKEASKPPGSGPQRHVEGIAADIRAIGLSQRELYLTVRRGHSAFTGIGVNPFAGYIHLDIRQLTGSGPIGWSYNRAGKTIRWDGRWENLPK